MDFHLAHSCLDKGVQAQSYFGNIFRLCSAALRTVPGTSVQIKGCKDKYQSLGTIGELIFISSTSLTQAYK